MKNDVNYNKQQNMTTFARYYDNSRHLKEVSMSQMEELVNDEKNKKKIADLIYHRYYERYLKIFFFQSGTEETYFDQSSKESRKDKFNTEYKNGFAIMVNCCLLTETLASFLAGRDETPSGMGEKSFGEVFEKAGEYGNDLHKFLNKGLYKNVRNKLLHQGETYGTFKIRRTGKFFDESTKTINATKFCEALNEFLRSYTKELMDDETDWNGDFWEKCRKKLGHIITNARTL